MAESRRLVRPTGLVIEAVEWLPSGADSGLVRVRGRWTDPAREAELPALRLRRGDEVRRFDSLPDARFDRDPAVWRGAYLVPAALMDPAPDELWLAWESGEQAVLPEPARGFEPPATAAPSAPPDAGGEVIDRAVLAEHRARRAEAAEQAQARRAADALKAVEVLELRSAELERRLEALQAEAPPAAAEALRDAEAAAADAVPAAEAAAVAEALEEAVATVKRLRAELDGQRQRLRRSELLRGADAVALASLRQDQDRARRLQVELSARERELAQALARVDARTDEVAAATAALAELRLERDAAGRALDGERDAHTETQERLAMRERELSAIGDELADVGPSSSPCARPPPGARRTSSGG